MNIIMRGIIHRAALKKNIYSPVFGKARKEALCSGISGIACWAGYVIWRSKKWQAPVMTVISFAQVCISTMLLGIYFFGWKMGSNPFALLRNELNAPILFTNPDYLQFPKIYEGNDLNSALQNYWMVIHPPILFLGFASTIVPFAYAIAGLMKNDHTWIKPSIPWAAFSGAVLITGIMMGAAWAYESLNFGGYWAWDPVENAPLVAWLVMIGGLHTSLIYKSTGYSLKTTYLFYILSFCFVLYATFLTRSGILGDTSVHAFTEQDMNVQLICFVLIFFVPAMALYFYRSKSIPSIKKEESTLQPRILDVHRRIGVVFIGYHYYCKNIYTCLQQDIRNKHSNARRRDVFV